MLEILKAKLVAIFVTFQATYYGPAVTPPETTEQRDERVAMAAETLVDASEASSFPKSQQRIALLVAATVWYSESGLDYEVHAGGVSPVGHQDKGKARCLGQLQTWPRNTLLTKEQWLALAGTSPEATRRCADSTLAYLWYHADRCLRVGKANRWADPLRDDEVLLLFAAYGDGHCVAAGKTNRLRLATYRRFRAQMDRPLRSGEQTTVQVSTRGEQ